MQTHDYVPGLSGLKIDPKTGEFELNSVRLQIGSLPSDPQLIAITVGEWPDSELPSNAIERYKFIGNQVMKIPDEYRDSAEFTTEDFSFDCDGSDYRTTLTYERLETAEEVVARQQKAKAAGTRFSLIGGVLTVTHDGVTRIEVGNLEKPERPEPFIVVDGVTYINEAFIKEASVEGKVAAEYTVKTQLLNGKAIMAGLNLGGYTGDVPEPGAALEASDACSVLDRLSAVIGKSQLGEQLLVDAKQLETNLADSVKDVLRSELRQGGLLWRSR